MASWMLEESNAMEAEAAGDDGLSNPSGSMLEEQAGSLHEEAVTLEGEAINELLRAQCLGKVMKGMRAMQFMLKALDPAWPTSCSAMPSI